MADADFVLYLSWQEPAGDAVHIVLGEPNGPPATSGGGDVAIRPQVLGGAGQAWTKPELVSSPGGGAWHGTGAVGTGVRPAWAAEPLLVAGGQPRWAAEPLLVAGGQPRWAAEPLLVAGGQPRWAAGPLLVAGGRPAWAAGPLLVAGGRPAWAAGPLLVAGGRPAWAAGPLLVAGVRPWWVAGPLLVVGVRPWWAAGPLLVSHGGRLASIAAVCCLRSADIVLFEPGPATAHIVLRCDAQYPAPPAPPGPPAVVIPSAWEYYVTNTVALQRADTGAEIEFTSMRLSIGRDSWNWGFSADAILGDLAPGGPAEPLELIATINGQQWRVIASRSRAVSFGSQVYRLSGVGYAAALDAPWAPQRVFGNPAGLRSAAQLIDDVLTVNGVSLGWSVDFGLDDWSVPAGAWSHQGTYASAVRAIAAAAGGYVQADPALQKLWVLPAYPVLPWNWAGATLDLQLPADAVVTEGVEWTTRAGYNGVYVIGGSVGAVGRKVVRDGTAGDVIAPMIVDQLITAEAAARQRGAAVLAATGDMALVSLGSVPWLDAAGGWIKPGLLVEYIDTAGVARRGVTRGVDIQVSGVAAVWQSITVETSGHV